MDSMDYNSEDKMALTLTPLSTEFKLSNSIINRHLQKDAQCGSSILVINGNCLNTTQDQDSKYINKITIENNYVRENEPKNNTIVDLKVNHLENENCEDENIGEQEQNTHFPDNASLIKEDCLNTTQDQDTKYGNKMTIENNDVTENGPKNNTIVYMEVNHLENKNFEDENIGEQEQNTHFPDNASLIKEDCLNTTQDQDTKYGNKMTIENNDVTENGPKNNTIVYMEVNHLENKNFEVENIGEQEQNTHFPDNASYLEVNPLEKKIFEDENIGEQEQNIHFPDNAYLPEAIAPPISDKQMAVETRYSQYKTHDIKALPTTSVQISTDITDNPSSDIKRRLHDDSLDMRNYNDRLKTYANWPISFLKPETLANNGFYYLNRGDEVRCAFCKVEIMRWEVDDDPATDHKKWAPQCPFLRASGDQTPPVGRDECGVHVPPAATTAPIRMSGPANPRYSTLSSRLDSFKDWPLSLRQKPKDLADAGFFYTGQGDKTKCFYCDGGLKDWEDDDVPWEQHARWFDRCAYVLLVKGREYVQGVLADMSLIRSTPPAPLVAQSPAPPVAPPAAPAAPAPHADSEPVATTSDVDEKLCKICYESERNVCFVPCGHVVACATCALSTTKCPLCRRTFTNAVRLYFA